MRKLYYYLFVFGCAALLSCSRETAFESHEERFQVTEEAKVSVRVNSPLETKSQYDEGIITKIRNVFIVGIDENGNWKSEFAVLDSPSSSTSVSLGFKVGASIDLYVIANLGYLYDDVRALPVLGTGIPDMASLVYTLPETFNLSTSGIPMTGHVHIDSVTAGELPVNVDLKLLFSKVIISIDKNGITDNTDADVMSSGNIHLKQTSRRLALFNQSESRAVSSDDIFPSDIDWQNFSSSESYDMTHSNIVLYVPENMQGTVPGISTKDQKKEEFLPLEMRGLCTYVEYAATKSGADDGIEGDIVYRYYLGQNDTDDFSVSRDTKYNCTLSLTWNGLFYVGDWRIDNSGLSDGRLLTLSTTPHTTSSSFTNWGRLRRNVASQLYVNFSRDGGASWVHSAKDIDGWPYGWDLYIDGVKQAAGGSATAAGDLGWSYVGDPSRDQLFITPGSSSESSTPHTLQVKSSDGRIASNIVTFDVGLSPLGGKWMNDTAPLYVAQRGKILCYDPDNNPDELFIDADVHSTNPSKVAVVNNGDGTADVSILAPFAEGEVGIYIEDADGERRCDVEMEGLLPYWCFINSNDITTYVDAEFTKVLTLSKTSATSGAEYISNRMYVTADNYAVGRYLNYDLVKSTMDPTVNSDDEFIGLKSMAISSNNISLTMRLKTFNGLSFGTEESRIIDRLYLTMNTFGEERNAPDVSVIARNPFYFFSSTPTRGKVMNDYTLYKFPSNDYGWGTTEWSADNYTETASYSMSAPRIYIGNASNARFRSYFNDDGRVFGTAMLSGTLSTSSSTTMTYSMSGVIEGNIVNHGAGRTDFNIDVVCPADGSVLTKTFGYGYVRLHAFVYGEVIWTTNAYRFYTKPRLLHGKPIANGNPIVPDLLNFNYCNALLAPTWPYITGTDSMGGGGEDPTDPVNLQTAIMGNDATGSSLFIYHEGDWLGENGDCNEDTWFLPEQMGRVSSSNQAAFLKACVRRSVIPYTFSPDYNTDPGSTTHSHPEFYRASDYELQYDPTWTGARTYSLPSVVESNNSKRRLVILHVVRGRTESNTGFVDDSYTVDTYQAAPENGNGGWYFSYANRTATWRH